MTDTAKARAVRVPGLDALRGLAAAGVVVVHAALILPIGEGIGIWTRYFSLGVPLFFIISAFSLSAAYEGGLAAKDDIKRYAIRRLFRIAPLFYLMLAGWILHSVLQSGSIGNRETIIASILFIFSLIPKFQVSAVPAGWSIGVEMVFYAVFPLLLKRSSIRSALVYLAIAALASWGLNSLPEENMRLYFFWTHPITNAPYFCMGLLAWRIYIGHKRSLGTAIPVLFLGLGITVLAAMVMFGPEFNAQSRQVPILLIYGWGTAFTLIVLSQALRPIPILVNPVTEFLGKISYSLYLSHPLLIYASGITVWAASLATAPYLVLPTVLLFTFSAAIPLAWLLYRMVEVPFIRIGRNLTTGRRSPRGQPTDFVPLGRGR